MNEVRSLTKTLKKLGLSYVKLPARGKEPAYQVTHLASGKSVRHNKSRDNPLPAKQMVKKDLKQIEKLFMREHGMILKLHN